MKKYDYLIVGSGLFGATFSHFATLNGKSCLVIDKRPDIGGNLYCKNVEGIDVHVYGAHIFHTSSREVWEFVNSIVSFNRYTNCPVAAAPDGKLYNLPFNMNTFYEMWGVKSPAEALAKLDEQRAEARAQLEAEGVSEPRNLEEQALCLIGKDIYEKLIKHYTEKQWGRACTELPAFIIRRLPVRLTFDNNYFNDPYQGIPETDGYNGLIRGLLEGAEVRTGVDFDSMRESWRDIAENLVYTGPIDEYFGYCEGHLQWRTVRFEHEVMNTPNHQGNAVVNYTDAKTPWTRIIEHKHFETFGAQVYDNPHTVISREYSAEYHSGMEPYYPVNNEANNALAEKYRMLTAKEENVIFGGRLGTYRYLDMDKVILECLEVVKNVFGTALPIKTQS